MLLVLVPAIPFIGVLILILTRYRFKIMPFITCFITLILGFIILGDTFKKGPVTYKLILPGPFTPTFYGDTLSAALIILTALLWLITSIYGPEYMKVEERAKGFQYCTLFTLAAVLGVFLAGDLFTMLLFFEVMTITSFFWVIHRWDKEAIRAGYFYLFFSIAGGLLIALGMVLMGEAVGKLPPIGMGQVNPLNPRMFSWSVYLMIIGFGVKAGVVPLHLWLPHAHSAAPTPGSSLLSGLLIKVGAYGMIRVGGFGGWGIHLSGDIKGLGTVIMVLGICTMLIGVGAALLQGDAKKLLAYHSVSQMGYIVLGLGVGLFLGPDGSFGLSGAIYHIINHALFKAALFLGVGIIYVYTGKTGLYKQGGLLKSFPVTGILMLIASLGITGVPGLNGYASKTLLHHGISQVAEAGGLGFIWAERLFTLVGIGTTASFAKLYYLIFLGKPSNLDNKKQLKKGFTKEKFTCLQLAMGILILLIIGIGVKPKFLLNSILIPAVQILGISDTMPISNISFWNVKDITGTFYTLILGISFCWAGFRWGLFHWHPPLWLTLEGLGKLLGLSLSKLFRLGVGIYQFLIRGTKDIGRKIKNRLISTTYGFDHHRRVTVGKITLMGVSADAAILITVLIFLMVWYAIAFSIL